jgi:hypothetical protein
MGNTELVLQKLNDQFNFSVVDLLSYRVLWTADIPEIYGDTIVCKKT